MSTTTTRKSLAEAIATGPLLMFIAQVGRDVELPLVRPGDRLWATWPSATSLVLPAADIPTTEDLEEMFDEG